MERTVELLRVSCGWIPPHTEFTPFQVPDDYLLRTREVEHRQIRACTASGLRGGRGQRVGRLQDKVQQQQQQQQGVRAASPYPHGPPRAQAKILLRFWSDRYNQNTTLRRVTVQGARARPRQHRRGPRGILRASCTPTSRATARASAPTRPSAPAAAPRGLPVDLCRRQGRRPRAARHRQKRGVRKCTANPGRHTNQSQFLVFRLDMTTDVPGHGQAVLPQHQDRLLRLLLQLRGPRASQARRAVQLPGGGLQNGLAQRAPRAPGRSSPTSFRARRASQRKKR